MIKFEDRRKEFCNSIRCKGSFQEIIDSMDKKLKSWVIQDIHELTLTAKWTIEYNWASGRSEPDDLKKNLLSDYFCIPVDILFPKNK